MSRAEAKRKSAVLTRLAAAALAACVGVAHARARGLSAESGRDRRDAAVNPVLGVFRPPGLHQPVLLARLDRLSLAPLQPHVRIGEYHYARSFSPDRKQLALAISAPGEGGRVGIRIVDVERMEVRHDVVTGIAAEALGWLTPNRIVGALQRRARVGSAVVVDTDSGTVVRRERLPLGLGAHGGAQPAVPTANGLVVLLNSREGRAPAHLAIAAVHGSLRSVRLDRIQMGRSAFGLSFESGGFAIDPAGERAFVVSARAPLAEVDLKEMQVRYRPLDEVPSLASRCPSARSPGSTKEECSSTREVSWLGSGKLAVFGADYMVDTERLHAVIPAGVTVLDTERWAGWTVPNASKARLAGDRLLAHTSVSRRAGEPGIGLRAFSLDGRPLFHLFGQEQVFDVQLAGGYAYVRTDHAVRIVDPKSGRIIREFLPPHAWFELLDDTL